MTSRTHPWCCIHASNKWTPTNDREGVTRTRLPCDSAFFLRARSAWPPFPSIEPPSLPQPIDLTEGDRNLHRRFCERMEHQAAWTGGIVVEELPQKGLGRFRHLSAGTQCWTCVVNWGALGYRHASILLKDQDGIFHQNSQCLFFSLMKSYS